MDQNVSSVDFGWFAVEMELVGKVRPQMLKESAASAYVRFVNNVLTKASYEQLCQPDEWRIKHLNEINAEYHELMEQLAAEGSESNETTSINSAGQENCEAVG